MNDDEAPTTAADIRSLAEQAEAEAAEAEALAAAARARARAIQLRRQAELIESQNDAAAPEEVTAETSIDTAATKDDAGDPVDAEGDDTREIASEDTESTDTESADEGPAEAAAEPDGDTLLAPVATPTRRWARLRRPKWSTVAAGLAIVVILGALAGSGYMFKEHRDAVRQRERAAEFAAAARQGVVTLTSLDFNNAKQGVQHILENSTGSFKDDFIKMADDFTKVVEQSKVISQGSVQATAVDLDTMTDNSAVVLVGSTSEVTNAAGAKQDPRNYRLIVTVARDGGQLKIAKVEFVP
ncbi:MAG: hypothetical protein P4L48_24240 [Mycobacterium sp.]|nr:hypothetical protein [Mycobacterium sp.]